MRLVKIDGLYINPDRVDGVAPEYRGGESTGTTCVYVGGESEPFKVKRVIEEVVKALTEVQELRWIPVTERLPKESDDYLVTNDDGDVEMAYFAHPKDYAISNGEWRGIWYEDDVIAWMQLPKPYKGGQEDGKA